MYARAFHNKANKKSWTARREDGIIVKLGNFTTMQVEVGKAVEHFYASPSFELVYCEAVANALDAQATKINIDIYYEIPKNSPKGGESKNKSSSIEIKIQDNGVGFTDKNFLKFSKLLKTNDAEHKGLGRLIYLCYFKEANIESEFEITKQKRLKRKFIFNESFDGEKEDEVITSKFNRGTTIFLKGFKNKRIKANSMYGGPRN